MTFALRAPALIAALAAAPAFAAPDYDAMSQRAVDAVIAPSFQDFAAAVAPLPDAVSAVCDKPGALDAARAAFDKASSAWAAARVYSFGAAELFNRAYRVEFWPDERNRVSKQLRQTIAEADPKILEPKGFDRASVAIQGLPALERILFADDAPDGYACALGGAIALNIATIANELNDAWADPDKAFFTLETGEARAQRLVTASVATLAGLRDRKLARPMREDAASARPKMLNKWRSGRAGRDVSADLMALERLYDAAFRPEIGASPIDGLLRDAREKAAALEDTLFTAVADADTRPQADALLAAVKALEDVYAETLAKQLGLVVGFNSLDGD